MCLTHRAVGSSVLAERFFYTSFVCICMKFANAQLRGRQAVRIGQELFERTLMVHIRTEGATFTEKRFGRVYCGARWYVSSFAATSTGRIRKDKNRQRVYPPRLRQPLELSTYASMRSREISQGKICPCATVCRIRHVLSKSLQVWCSFPDAQD